MKCSYLLPEDNAVYLMVNLESGDMYVGESGTLVSRWKQHVSLLRRRKHPLSKVNTLVRKHGVDSFRFLVLEDGLRHHTRRRLPAERRWIKLLSPSLNRPRKVNMGGGWFR